jgi:hypothetical protein
VVALVEAMLDIPPTVGKLAVYRIGDDEVHFEFQDSQGMGGLMEVPVNISGIPENADG